MTDTSDKLEPRAAEIEAAAAAIGFELGPPDGTGGGWTITYRPSVRWPQDYSEREQTKLRNAATLALEAALSTRPAPAADTSDKLEPRTAEVEVVARAINRARAIIPLEFADESKASQEYARRLARAAVAALSTRPAPAAEFTLAKRPVAFRVQDKSGNWGIYKDEAYAQCVADIRGLVYQGLYVRDGTPLVDAPAAEWQQPWDTAPKDGRWIIACCWDGVSIERVSWGRDRRGGFAWCSGDKSYGDGPFGGWIDCPQRGPSNRKADTPQPGEVKK